MNLRGSGGHEKSRRRKNVEWIGYTVFMYDILKKIKLRSQLKQYFLN